MEQVKSTYGANDKLSKSVYHILLTCLTVTDSVDDRLVEEEAEKHKIVIFLLIMVFIIKLMSQPNYGYHYCCLSFIFVFNI